MQNLSTLAHLQADFLDNPVPIMQQIGRKNEKKRQKIYKLSQKQLLLHPKTRKDAGVVDRAALEMR